MNITKFLNKPNSKKKISKPKLFYPSTTRETGVINYKLYSLTLANNQNKPFKSNKSQRITNSKFTNSFKNLISTSTDIKKSKILSKNYILKSGKINTKNKTSEKNKKINSLEKFNQKQISEKKILNKSENLYSQNYEELINILQKENKDLEEKIKETNNETIKIKKETEKENNNMKTITKTLKDVSKNILDLMEFKKNISTTIIYTNKKINDLKIKIEKKEQKKNKITNELEKILDSFEKNNKINKSKLNKKGNLKEEEFEIEFL